jgi:hypothetical protein
MEVCRYHFMKMPDVLYVKNIEKGRNERFKDRS